MNQDKTQIYPTTEDIHGMDAKKPKEITYEEIQEMIEATQKQFKSAKEQVPIIESKISDLYVLWRDSLVKGESDSVLKKYENDITRLKTQVEALGRIDVKAEAMSFLKRNKKLAETCKLFEQQQLAALKEIGAEKQAAIKVFQETRKPFLEATRALAFTNCKAQRVLGKLNSLCNFTGRNVSYNSLYELVFFQMVDPSEKFIREWEGGCLDTVFPEPGQTIVSDNTEQPKAEINESEAQSNG